MGWLPRIDPESLRQRWLRWRRWLVLHLGWWRTDLQLLAKRSVSEFLDDHCAQLAASMSYYVFFLAVSAGGSWWSRLQACC